MKGLVLVKAGLTLLAPALLIAIGGMFGLYGSANGVMSIAFFCVLGVAVTCLAIGAASFIWSEL